MTHFLYKFKPWVYEHDLAPVYVIKDLLIFRFYDIWKVTPTTRIRFHETHEKKKEKKKKKRYVISWSDLTFKLPHTVFLLAYFSSSWVGEAVALKEISACNDTKTDLFSNSTSFSFVKTLDWLKLAPTHLF